MKTYDEKYKQALELVKELEKFGAKRLTGTAKQKKWAEVIRYEFITEECSGYKKEILAMYGIANTAKFWINARKFLNADQLFLILREQEEASEEAKKAAELLKQKNKETKNLVKFYGGKALVGEAKDRQKAEKLRQDFLKSDRTTDEEKQELLVCSEFVNDAEFWINNKSIDSSNVKNIINKLQGFDVLLEKLSSALSEKGLTENKIAALSEIRNYLSTCDFYFKSPYKRP